MYMYCRGIFVRGFGVRTLFNCWKIILHWCTLDVRIYLKLPGTISLDAPLYNILYTNSLNLYRMMNFNLPPLLPKKKFYPRIPIFGTE